MFAFVSNLFKVSDRSTKFLLQRSCAIPDDARVSLQIDPKDPEDWKMKRTQIDRSIQLRAIDRKREALFAFDQLCANNLLQDQHRIACGGVTILELKHGSVLLSDRRIQTWHVLDERNL